MKVLASDYDGTLKQGDIRACDLLAIKQFRQAGNAFGIVTGRSLSMLVSEFQQYPIEFDFIITNNGGCILDQDLHCIKSYPIAFATASQVIQDLKKHHDCMFGIASWDKSHTIQDGAFIPMPKNFNPVVMLEEYSYDEVCKDQEILSFYLRDTTNEASKQLMHDLQGKYQKEMNFFYNNGTVDAMACGVSKQSGVRFIQEYLHADQCFVIGDAHNDIDMIQAFQGFCVTAACDEVKQIATCCYQGIAECIRDISKI